jgi:hypothetical protein
MNKRGIFGKYSLFSFGKAGNPKTFWENWRANGSMVHLRRAGKVQENHRFEPRTFQAIQRTAVDPFTAPSSGTTQ